MLARGEDIDKVLEALTHGLTQKMLHGTMAELHANKTPIARTQLAHTVSKPVPAPEPARRPRLTSAVERPFRQQFERSPGWPNSRPRSPTRASPPT